MGSLKDKMIARTNVAPKRLRMFAPQQECAVMTRNLGQYITGEMRPAKFCVGAWVSGGN